MPDQPTPVTDDDNKRSPEWPKTRTTILDVCRGKQVIGKRVIVETCRYGKRWGASYVASTEQITHAIEG